MVISMGGVGKSGVCAFKGAVVRHRAGISRAAESRNEVVMGLTVMFREEDEVDEDKAGARLV
jgi:hypothetical protein